MSIEAVAPTTCGSFLYEGCYRPRGGLSFAERAAWGLSSTSKANPPIRHASLSGSKPMSEALRPSKHFAIRVTRAFIAPSRARTRSLKRRRFRVICASQFAGQRLKTTKNKRTSAGNEDATKWRRLRLKVLGRNITCLSVRGRVFVSGELHQREKLT